MKRRLTALLLVITLLTTLLAGCRAGLINLETSKIAPTSSVELPTGTEPTATATTVPELLPTEPPVTEPFVNEYGLTVLSAPGIATPRLAPDGYWYDSINTYTGAIILFVSEIKYGFEDIRFEIVADGGRYTLIKSPYDITDFKQKFTVNNNTRLLWEAGYDWETGYPLMYANFKECYTRIIVYSGEHIVGYAVLRYERKLPEDVFLWYEPKRPELGEVVLLQRPVEDYSPVYRVVELESVLFPMVDGQYQDVPLEYINQRFEDACILWKSAL